MKPETEGVFSERILAFFRSLYLPGALPKGVHVMNPYRDLYTFGLCQAFYKKYYSYNMPRILLLGINPGRHGAGLTGISFTDPVKLENVCGVKNTLTKKTELSADFIYRMIDAYGGPDKFYSRYFISAVSPLGFTHIGTNINYYDNKKLEKVITPFVVSSIRQLISIGCELEKCFCIGEGKNFTFLNRLNQEHRWFDQIIPLAHPRFIMQYRRKKIDEYIGEYLKKLE